MVYRKISYIIRCTILLIFITIAGCTTKQDPEELGLQEEFAGIQIDTSSYAEHKPQRIKYLFIHCIATDPNRGRWSPLRLKSFFTDPKPKGNGWNRYGYHDYIDYNANVHEITPLDCDDLLQFNELTYNAAGYNNVSIAISLEGGCEFKNGKLIPKNNFTPQQLTELEKRIIYYKQKYPWIQVRSHNEVSSKACPVLDIKKLKIQ
jgi:hypothetical protein